LGVSGVSIEKIILYYNNLRVKFVTWQNNRIFRKINELKPPQQSNNNELPEGGKRTAGRASRKAGSFLNRECTIVAPSYSRWLIPAALCVHLWIGQAYVSSVFNLPMTNLIGIAESVTQTIFIRSNPRGFAFERDIDRFLDEIQDEGPDGRYHSSGDTGDNEATHCGRPPRIIV
jgi:hypothetical protein